MARKSTSNPLVFSTDGSHRQTCPVCGEHPCCCVPVVAMRPEETTVRMRLERKGRGGKAVTVVYEFPVQPPGDETLEQLARQLKRHCGTGGGVKNGTLEIQGDQRDKVQAFLEAQGYRVRRSGG